MPFAATWIDLEIINAKWSKSERKIQVPYDSTYVWYLKYDTNELIYETHRHTHTDHTCACQGGSGTGEGQTGSLGLPDAKNG